jgi:hypothetical protein
MDEDVLPGLVSLMLVGVLVCIWVSATVLDMVRGSVARG